MRPETLAAAAALALGLLFLSPALYAIWMSFQTAEAWYRGETADTLDNDARYLLNSVIVSGFVTPGGIVTATMAAFAFARWRFRGGDLLFGATVATLMIPGHLTLIPNDLTLARAGLLDTYAGLILPATASGFAAFFLRQYIRGIPRALDEAAYIDGATPLQVLWRAIVPVARPAILSMALFLFIGEWNSYIRPLIGVGREDMSTLQIGLARLYRINPGEGAIDWPLVMAAPTLTLLPVLAGFAVVERHLVRGITLGAVK